MLQAFKLIWTSEAGLCIFSRWLTFLPRNVYTSALLADEILSARRAHNEQEFRISDDSEMLHPQLINVWLTTIYSVFHRITADRHMYDNNSWTLHYKIGLNAYRHKVATI